MAYEIKLINPHKQFGKFNYSLLFHDTTGEYPDARWEKKYPDTVTKQQIATDVKRTLKAWGEEIGLTFDEAKSTGISFSVDVAGGTKIFGTL